LHRVYELDSSILTVSELPFFQHNNFDKREIAPMTVYQTTRRPFVKLFWLMIIGAAFPTLCAASPILNEVVGSTRGTDAEFIELYGTADTPLNDLSIIVVESDDRASNGTIDWRFDFGGTDVVGDNKFFLLGTSLIPGLYGISPNVIIPTNSIENSSYTIALIQTSSISGTTIGGSEIVLDALGVTDGETSDFFFFDAPVIGPDGAFLPAGGRRIVDGVDTDTAADWTFSDFANGPSNTPTPGTYAVPLPGTLALLVAGLMGLQFRRKA